MYLDRRPFPKAVRYILRTTGVANLLFAILGSGYNLMTFMAFRGMGYQVDALKGDAPYFETAFKVMSAICVAFYVALAVSGIQLLRRKIRWAYLAIAALALETIYFVAPGVAALHPEYGMSIAAATGVSGGGLSPQIVLLYPLWGTAALVTALVKARDAAGALSS